MRGLFKGGVYFVQLEPDHQCGNNSRVERIQGNTVYPGEKDHINARLVRALVSTMYLCMVAGAHDRRKEERERGGA